MYTIQEIAHITEGQLIGALKGNVEFLLTDSRQLLRADNTLFIALVSQRKDAHVFINELHQKGIRLFFWDYHAQVASLVCRC